MNQNIPAIITAATMQQLAAPDETLAVRVMMVNNSGGTTGTFRGIKKKYLMQRHGTIGRHFIDIPASLWSQGMPAERYRDNPSIAHDIQSRPNVAVPLVTTIVPWGNAEAATRQTETSPELANAFETLTMRFFEQLNPERFKSLASDKMAHVLGREIGPTITEFLMASGRPSAVAFIEKFLEPSDPEAAPAEKSETPAAKRMREKRKRDSEARKAREAATTQPA